jgi:hypothetical protein
VRERKLGCRGACSSFEGFPQPQQRGLAAAAAAAAMTPTVTAAAAATALAEAAFLSPAQGTHKEIPFQPLMHVGAPGTFPSDGAGCCRGHCGGCCPHVANTSPPSGAEADCACGFDAVLCFLLGGFCGGAAGASAAAAAWLSAASQGVSTAKHPPPPCWGLWAACAASGDISARAGPSPGRGMRNIARQAEHSHSGGRLSCQGALHLGFGDGIIPDIPDSMRFARYTSCSASASSRRPVAPTWDGSTQVVLEKQRLPRRPRGGRVVRGRRPQTRSC